MDRGRLIIYVIVGFIVVNIILMQVGERLAEDEKKDESDQDVMLKDKDKFNILFQVTIPARTPDLDAIILHVGLELEQMIRVNDTFYQLEIDPVDYNLGEGAWIDYGYSRGGFQAFAEDNWVVFESWPRQVHVGEISETHDKVEAWKWFPNEQLNEIDIESQAGNISVAPRAEFWKGVQFIDFWTDEWVYQYDSSIERLKRLGYEWIMLSPPWDIKSFDPPIISDTNVTVPAYPEDKLRNHIKAFKDAGFKVALRIQVCCTAADATGKDAIWWNQWFDQYNEFIKYHADLSREENVDALIFGVSLYGMELPLNPETPVHANASAQWQRLIATAKTSNTMIGMDLLAWGASQLEDTTSVLPWPASGVDFFGDLDFIGIDLWGDYSNKTNPTQEDINIGAQKVFEHIDYTYNQLNLPIIFPGIAYQSMQGSALPKGGETYFTWGDPADISDEYNSTQQAMVYEAIMQQVAQKDYIKGLFPFGYWYVDAPQTVDDMSIRDKMAERILVGWLQYFPNSSSLVFDLIAYDDSLTVNLPFSVGENTNSIDTTIIMSVTKEQVK